MIAETKQNQATCRRRHRRRHHGQDASDTKRSTDGTTPANGQESVSVSESTQASMMKNIPVTLEMIDDDSCKPPGTFYPEAESKRRIKKHTA